MARTTPVVQAETVTWSVDRHEHQLTVGTSAWYAWLEGISMFAFVSDRGTFTARKEPRQHSGTYWKAYRKREGKLHRAYLGKSCDLTLERLNAVAVMLSGKAETPERSVSRNETLQVHQASINPLPTNVGVTQPLKPLKSPPKHNLPLQLTSFVGREQDAAAAVKLLQRPEVHLLTLTGPAGVGKTRLALQVATDLLESCPDGVYFVSLASLRDPDLVLPTIAQTLALREVGGHSLLALLQDKQILLGLDNFEQVVTAAPSLIELLETCRALKILVTSREALHLRAEYQFPVPPLALPDLTHLPKITALVQYPAVNLFLQRAQAVRPDFQLTPGNAAAIAELCIHLDGLPLAIELAAARVKWLAPQELLARLDCRLQLLTGGARDLPERQQTLRNTLKWSYDLLDGAEQQLFRRLSVFVGGCTWEAIEAISAALDGEAEWVLDGVTSLIDKSLLQQIEHDGNDPRFLMLETIREYGLDCLAKSGEKEVMQEAHAAYFLRLAETAEPELQGQHPAIWWGRLEREYDNLRTAMYLWLEREEGAMALRLGCALWWFWDSSRVRASEGRTFLERALAKSEGITGAMRAKALYAVGNFAARMGDFDRAKAFCKESLALFQEMGDRKKVGHAFAHLGFVACLNSELVAARTYFEESLVIAREVEDKTDIGWPLWWLAYVIFDQGEHLRSLTLAEESLAFFQEAGNAGAIVQSLLLLAQIHFYSQGNVVKAQAIAEESLALAKEMNDPGFVVEALDLLGQIALLQGKAVQARSLFEEILARGEKEERDKAQMAYVTAHLAQVEAREGDHAAARAHYEASLACLKDDSYKLVSAFSLEGLASVVAAQGDLVWAVRLWGAVEALRHALGTPIFPIYRAEYEHAVTAARDALGAQAFTAAWAEGGIMTPEQAVAVQGQVILSQPSQTALLAAPPAKVPTTHLNGLTPREMDVLRLLTQGLTSAQMSEQLVIGVVTVNFHVRSIYNKLGISSRSAATRYAIEHRLV